MEKDYELEQIFQEARENYNQRLVHLKNSLKSISTPEFPPYFNHPESPHPSNLRPTLINSPYSLSETSLNTNFPIYSEKDQKSNKSNPNYLKHLENTIELLRKKNEDFDSANIDLRRRLKEATTSIHKLQQNTIKQPEDNKTSKFHYKKKVSTLKYQLSQILNENKVLAQELADSQKREQSTKELCKSQISEISEEFANKFKQASNYYKESLAKLKNSVKSENKEKELLEAELRTFENNVKILQERQKNIEGELEAQYKSNEKLKEMLDKKEAQVEDYQRVVSIIKEEFQIKMIHLQEENNLRSQMNLQLNEELENKNKTIAALKGQLENFHIEFDAENSPKVLELTLNKLSQKTEMLVAENKNLNLELNKLYEALKNSEISNKILKTSNEIQENELNRLNKALTDSVQASEECLSGLKIQYSKEVYNKTEEAQKEFIKLSVECRELYEKLKIFQENEEKYKFKIEILQKELNESDSAVNKFKAINSELLNSHNKLTQMKERFSSQVEKIRTFWQVLGKLLKQHLSEFNKNLRQNSEEIMKFVQFGIENARSLNEFELKQIKNNYLLAANSLEKSNKQVAYLEAELKVCKDQLVKLENDSFLELEQKKSELEQSKRKMSQGLKQVLGFVNDLEVEFEHRYDDVIENVADLRQTVIKEGQEKVEKYLSTLEYCQNAMEFYKTRLNQIESEKMAEKDSSETELISLQMKLSQTLKNMRE